MENEDLLKEETGEKEELQRSADSSISDLDYESLAYLNKEKAERLVQFLQYSGIEGTKNEYDALSGTYQVLVQSPLFERARNFYDVFSQNELSQNEEPVDITSSGSLYENASEKQKDYFSSAITFFICGVAGLVILGLNDLGILKLLSSTGPSFILMNVVLGGLFIAFIIIGVLSYKNAKKAKAEAEQESSVIEQLAEWLPENVTADKIEASYSKEIPEEMKYFSRSEYIKNAIKAEFADYSEDLIEMAADRYIEKLFHA